MDYFKLWEKRIPYFNEKYLQTQEAPSLTPYLLDDGKRHACVLVCPGGGFTKRCDTEGDEIAIYLNQMGLHVFVLNYRVMPYSPMVGIVDAKRAIQYIRYYSEQYHIIPDRIGMIGFSAGGMLACYTAETYHQAYSLDYDQVGDEIDKVSSRPDYVALCYATISLKREHMAIDKYELAKRACPDSEAYEIFVENHTCENLVHKDMPPIFLWHCCNDQTVPISGTLAFINALQQKNIAYEAHLFPEGGHGKGITRAMQIPGINQWVQLYRNWLERIKMI